MGDRYNARLAGMGMKAAKSREATDDANAVEGTNDIKRVKAPMGDAKRKDPVKMPKTARAPKVEATVDVAVVATAEAPAPTGMRLRAEEHRGILALFARAREDPSLELEANFVGYGVSYQDMCRVVKAAANTEGFQALPESHQLDVTPARARTPRLTIDGQEAIRGFCDSLQLVGTSAVDKTDAPEGPVPLPLYGIRVNLRREAPLDAAQVSQELQHVDRHYRMKHRRSFAYGAFRLDCSITQMGDKLPLSQPKSFEVEVELVDASQPTEALVETFVRLLTFVYCNLSSSPYVLDLRARKRVLEEYGALVGKQVPPTVSDPARYFVGPKPVTLTWENVTKEPVPGAANVWQGYTVTDKADGERHLLMVAEGDRCFIINSRLHVRYTGVVLPGHRGTLLDGELVEKWKMQGAGSAAVTAAFYAFDAYYYKGEPTFQRPLVSAEKSRVDVIASCVAAARESNARGHVQLRAKAFASGDGDAMKAAIASVLDAPRDYETDGIIFTPAAAPVGASRPGEAPRLTGRWEAAKKWKPPQMNTIDFLVRFTGKVLSGGVECQDAQLLVGSDVSAVELDPVAVLTGRQVTPPPQKYGERVFGEVLFKGPPLCASGEAIFSGAVVEFAYEEEAWSPLRVRADKTQLYAAGGIAGAANDYNTAARVLETIRKPVTEGMVRGSEEPSYVAEEDLYYSRDVSRKDLLSRPMLNFHTLGVKGAILLQPLRRVGATSLLDLGCGKGSDLSRYLEAGLKRVVGLDANEDNLLNKVDGAYARLYQTRTRRRDDFKGRTFLFGQWDVSRRFERGPELDIADPSLRQITAAALGLTAPAQLRQGLADFYEMARRPFDAVSAQFMVHYMFSSGEALDGFLDNVASSLAPGGFFVGTCMDGDRVNSLLAKTANGVAEGHKGGKVLWRITKSYEVFDTDPSKNLGKEILVFLESINKEIPEYLVDFRLLETLLGRRGLTLAGQADLSRLGVRKATGMFGEVFEELQSNRQGVSAALVEAMRQMSPDERRFSFLNRYFVFTKAAT